MAKCGHDICPDDNCGLKHPFNGGARFRCRRIQSCIEGKCSTLKALGPSGFVLFDACIGHCHDDSAANYPGKYPTQQAYICANFDPITLADYGGVNICGVAESETKVGQLKAGEDSANAHSKKSIAFIGFIILALLFMLFWKK